MDEMSPDLGPVLVTGGTGFLGRVLVGRLLAQGRSVSVLARSAAPDLEARGVRLIRARIDDPAAVAEACRGADTVFHVAARVGVWGPYDEFFRANVLGTRAVLAGCAAHGVRRLIHTSTPSVVYNGRDLAGADESLPLTKDCPSPYPLTKALAEAEVLAANGAQLRTIALRPHLIWGPGRSPPCAADPGQGPGRAAEDRRRRKEPRRHGARRKCSGRTPGCRTGIGARRRDGRRPGVFHHERRTGCPLGMDQRAPDLSRRKDGDPEDVPRRRVGRRSRVRSRMENPQAWGRTPDDALHRRRARQGPLVQHCGRAARPRIRAPGGDGRGNGRASPPCFAASA